MDKGFFDDCPHDEIVIPTKEQIRETEREMELQRKRIKKEYYYDLDEDGNVIKVYY